MSLPGGLPVPIIHENIKRKFLPSSKIAQEDYPVWENYLYQEDSQLFWKEAQDTSSWDTWACSLQSLGLSPHGWVYSMETDTWPDWERCSPQYSFYSRLTSQSSPKPMWPLPSSALILDHPWHRAASAPMVLDNYLEWTCWLLRRCWSHPTAFLELRFRFTPFVSTPYLYRQSDEKQEWNGFFDLLLHCCLFIFPCTFIYSFFF